jgi:NitT/TauT family transport system substrate-binding protein
MPKQASIFAAALAGGLLLAGCGGAGDGTSSASADGPITMQIGRAAAFAQFPLFVAEEEGFWEDAGIDPEFVSIAAGPEQTAAQVSGELDVVDNVPNNLLPIIDKGVDIVAFTQTFKASQFDIIVDADYPLTAEQGDWEGAMQDLKGAKVGVIARGTGAEDIARTLFKEAGIDPESATYIATGLPSTTMAAMQNEQIDMAITLEPGIAQAVESGLAVSPFSVRAGEAPESLVWPGVVGTTTREYADKNPEALKAYISALEQTMDFIRDPANEDRVIELMQSTLSVPANVATYLYENNLDDFSDTVPLTEEEVAKLDNAADWVLEIGKIANEHPADEWTLVVE